MAQHRNKQSISESSNLFDDVGELAPIDLPHVGVPVTKALADNLLANLDTQLCSILQEVEEAFGEIADIVMLDAEGLLTWTSYGGPYVRGLSDEFLVMGQVRSASGKMARIELDYATQRLSYRLV